MESELTAGRNVKVPDFGAGIRCVSEKECLDRDLRRHCACVGDDQRHVKFFKMAVAVVAGVDAGNQHERAQVLTGWARSPFARAGGCSTSSGPNVLVHAANSSTMPSGSLK